MSRRSPRFAVVEQEHDGRRDRFSVILYHDAEPIMRLYTNCGMADSVGLAALINDCCESVSILNKVKQ